MRKQKKVCALPLEREAGKVRTLEQIRGRSDMQLRVMQKGRPKGESQILSEAKLKQKRERKLPHQRERDRAEARRQKLKIKLEQELDKLAEKIQEKDKEIAERERILSLADKAPSVKEMRGAVSALFKEYDLSAIEELMKLVKKTGKGALPAKDKVQILKFLAAYEAPQPKSVDVQADLNAHVSVGMIDFTQASQEAVKNVTPRLGLSDDDYKEFENEDSII